jgi:hypothetical protein
LNTGLENEFCTLAWKISASLRHFVDDASRPQLVDHESVLNCIDKLIQDDRHSTAKARLQAWRDRVTSGLKGACQWLKGGTEKVLFLDTPLGTTVHPQEITDEVLRRCELAFATAPPDSMADDFMYKYSHFIDMHQVFLELVTGDDFRKAASQKLDGAVGTDGWHGRELQCLPDPAWDSVATLFNLIESVGRWPVALKTGIVAALVKKIQGGKTHLRLLSIMPRLTRAWSSLRARQLTEWSLKWLPRQLSGGVRGRGTLTASVPLVLAFTKAQLLKEPLYGATLDLTSCFDKICVSLAVRVLRSFGLPEALARTIIAMYEDLPRIVRVGRASSREFHGKLGILQGCALSCLLLNGIFTVWIRHVEANIGEHQLCILSGYLDDRCLAARPASALQRILELTRGFDDDIGALWNIPKCQLFGTPAAEDWDMLDAILPQAERPHRPWSLGYSLPTAPCSIDDMSTARQVGKRYEKAIVTARRAACLPHDIRALAIEVCVPTQFGYGAEFVPPTPSEAKCLTQAIRAALFGESRVTACAGVVWTVLYKGHKLLPECVIIRNCIALLFAIARHSDAQMRADLDFIWHSVRHRRRTRSESPFHVLAEYCHKLGWTWAAPTVIHVASVHEERDVDLALTDWPEIAHYIREHCRAYLLGSSTAGSRFDTQGLEGGADFAATRAVLDSSSMTFLEKGVLRTILTGSCVTPSRLVAAGRLTDAQAVCVHCGSEVESLGHRFWRCAAWLHVRAAHDLADFAEDDFPRCLTRCGLLPLGCALGKQRLMKIQKYMVAVTLAASRSPEAVRQLELAGCCKHVRGSR